MGENNSYRENISFLLRLNGKEAEKLILYLTEETIPQATSIIYSTRENKVGHINKEDFPKKSKKIYCETYPTSIKGDILRDGLEKIAFEFIKEKEPEDKGSRVFPAINFTFSNKESNLLNLLKKEISNYTSLIRP